MVNNNDFASGLLSGFMNTYVPIAKMGLEREQAAQLAAYRQAQLDQMKFEQGRQKKADWQNDYDKSMKQLANNYLAGVLTGKNPSLPDSSVLGYMDPSVLAAIQQKDQDRAMTGAFMKALGGDIAPGTQPSTYASPRASQGPSGQQPSSGSGDGPIWQRQNNPGNLRVPGQTSFQSFPTMQDGLNAYYDQIDRYGQRGLNTIRKIVSTYAPPNENNTNGYIALVSKATGLGPDDPIDFTNLDQKIALGKAMTSVEGSGKALTDDMHRRAVGLLPPGSEDQKIMDIATNGNTVQLAQAGGQTMTDASSPPQEPGQSSPNKWADLASKAAPFVAAPGKVGDMAKNIVGVAKTMTDLTQPQNDIVEREDGTYMVDKRTGQYRKIEGIPGKDTGNFTDPNDKLIFKLAPGYGNGNSEEQDRQYEQAWYNKYGNPRTMPDGSIVRMTPPPNIPTPNGMQTGEVAGKKPLTANDAGKIQGANLSTTYLDDVEKKLFPDGKYDRMAMMKSYLPGTDEADIRNKIREAIGYALYLKTGAAATPKEIAEQETLYAPGLADSEMTARSKLDRLKAFLNSVVQGTGRDKANGATGSWDQQMPASPDLKAKYGLE